MSISALSSWAMVESLPSVLSRLWKTVFRFKLLFRAYSESTNLFIIVQDKSCLDLSQQIAAIRLYLHRESNDRIPLLGSF
jgi:hypothetical protein